MTFLFFLFLIFYPLLFLPRFGFHAEMFAESASNYFHTANNLKFFEGILVTDYGYLPLLPRLMAYFVEFLGVPLKYVPLAYDLIATIIIALCVFSFVSSWGARVMRSQNLRIVFALLIFMLPDYELKTFINFSYWLFIPLFLLSLRAWFEPEKLSPGTWLGFVALGCIAILSKPLFFVVLPVLGIVAVRYLILFFQVQSGGGTYLWRALSLLGLPISALVQLAISKIQIGASLSGASNGLASQALAPALKLESLLWALLYLPLSLIEKIFGHLIIHNTSRVLLLVFAAFIFWVLMKKMWKGIRTSERREFCVVLLMAAFVIFLNAVISLSSYPNYLEDISNFRLRPVLSLFGIRHWFFANLAAYFVVLKIFDLYPRWHSTSRAFFLILLLFAGEHFSFPVRTINDSAYEHGNSDWAASLNFYEKPLREVASFCIPINPMMWFYAKGCEVFGDREDLRKFLLKDERAWSLPDRKYNFKLNTSSPTGMHWIGVMSRDALTEKNILSVKLNGSEVPVHLLSRHTAMTYLNFQYAKNIQEVEILFDIPVQLARNTSGEPAMIWAKSSF